MGHFGLDPKALQTACNLGPLLSHDDLAYACELRFASGDGPDEVSFMLREHRNRGPERAWELHRSGFPEAADVGSFAEIEGSHWLREQGYRWAYLPGWSYGRRIGWREADCAPERMVPVLRTIVTASQPEPLLSPRWQPATDAPVESLLSRYGARDDLGLEELGERELPTLAKKLVVALIAAAARNELSTVENLLSQTASFGMPDRREYDAWPLDSFANIENFTANLNLVTARFDAEAEFSCPAIKREHIDAVTRGASPMWCAYTSADGFDLLVFRLHTYDGRGQIDYVGMYESPPPEPFRLAPTEPPPPPMTPG